MDPISENASFILPLRFIVSMPMLEAVQLDAVQLYEEQGEQRNDDKQASFQT
jgi:hypothetical protein